MALTTAPITATVYGPDGQLCRGATVTALLSAVETYQGMVVPRSVSGSTDASGVCILNLWPNGLGSQGSWYDIVIETGLGADPAPFRIHVPDATPASMDDLLISTSTAVPVNGPVRSIAGQRGDVLLSDLGLGALELGYGMAFSTANGFVQADGTHTHTMSGTVRTTEGNTLVDFIKATNLGPQTGYGRRFGYVSYAYGTGGAFDLAEGVICRWERTDPANTGGTGMTQWRVAMTPKQEDPTCSHRTCIAEWNVVNRGLDNGWQKRRSNTLQSAVFLQIVPEAKDFSGTGGTPKNILAGFVFTNAPKGPETDALGYRPRVYNALLGEPNSIHETGRAFYWAGSDGTGGTGGGAPVAFAELDDAWQAGFRTNRATFVIDPYVLGPGQGMCAVGPDEVTRLNRWGFDANGALVFGQAAMGRGTAFEQARSGPGFGDRGDAQVRRLQLVRAVSSPSGVQLTADNGASTAKNRLALDPGTSALITGRAIARRASGPAPATAKWTVDLVVERSNDGTAIDIIDGAVTRNFADSALSDYTIAAVPDAASGALLFEVTGTGGARVLLDVEVTELVSVS